MHVAVVTDSTAYLPPGVAAAHGIAGFPLHLTVDGADALDGVDFTADQLAEALSGSHHGRRRQFAITTSQCTPAELRAAYANAMPSPSEPGGGVLAVHLSRHLSGTWESGRLAEEQLAHEAPEAAVRVVDSHSAAMGLGFPVLAAARAATAGLT